MFCLQPHPQVAFGAGIKMRILGFDIDESFKFDSGNGAATFAKMTAAAKQARCCAAAGLLATLACLCCLEPTTHHASACYPLGGACMCSRPCQYACARVGCNTWPRPRLLLLAGGCNHLCPIMPHTGNFVTDYIKNKFKEIFTAACTKETYGRGAGSVPDTCTDNKEMFSG